MAREITGYRECLMQINEKFPEKELLTKTDIYKFFGISRNTLYKRFPELWNQPFTSKTDLAKAMARRLTVS